jgi:hypothetical protein
MSPMSGNLEHIAGIGAGGIFDKVIFVISEIGGLSARSRLVDKGGDLLSGQKLERLGRRGMQGGLRHGGGRH